MTARERARACGLVFLCLSALLFLLGTGSAALTLRFLSQAETAVAEVVSSREAGTRSRVWETTLAVVTPEGTRLTAVWGSEVPLNVGQAVRVLYRREAPVQMRPDDAWSVWGWARVLGAMGAVYALIGGAALIVGQLLRPRPA